MKAIINISAKTAYGSTGANNMLNLSAKSYQKKQKANIEKNTIVNYKK
jgi:hypothetical protein